MTSIALETDTLRVAGDRIRVVVDAGTSGDRFELFELEGDVGSGPPPHAHPWLETYLMLDGEVSVELGGERQQVGPGAVVVVPAGVVHRFEIASPTARFVIATSGGAASHFFRDLDATSPGAPTPETLPAMIEVAKRHGLTSPLF